MEARLLKDNACDYLLVSLDDQSFNYLNSGMPVRMAFAVDNNEHLPWHQRKCMVAIVGKNLDFERHKVHKEGILKKGLVDKTYLIHYIAQMKKKLVQMATDELEIFDKQLQLEDHSMLESETTQNKEIEPKPAPKPLEFTVEVVKEPKEYLSAVRAAEMLNLSHHTLLGLAKTGKIKGERDSLGWHFIKADIENILKERPEFLTKIWNDCRSINKKRPGAKEIVWGKERYIHISKAEKILTLSDTAIRKYAKIDLIKHQKKPGKDYYLSLRDMEKLKANPPDWLKKSWSYFNSQR